MESTVRKKGVRPPLDSSTSQVYEINEYELFEGKDWFSKTGGHGIIYIKENLLVCEAEANVICAIGRRSFSMPLGTINTVSKNSRKIGPVITYLN